MDRNASISKAVLLSGICLPLAFFLGYLLASPDNLASIVVVGAVTSVLAFPILLQFHHQLLIIFWNSVIVFFFLPGQPNFGFVIAFGSLFLSIVTAALRRQQNYLHCWYVSYPLYALALVTVGTIYLRGGVAGRAFGSETWGAMRYFGVIAAIVGYFAFVSRPIEPNRGKLLAGLFFLSGITAIGSDLAYAAGPAFYFLYALFPANIAGSQAFSADELKRFTGLAWMSQACVWFMLSRYGIRGILNWYRPWRAILFVGLFVIGLFGGYRTTVILFLLVFFFQFWLEGLFKSIYLPVLTAMGLGLGLFVYTSATSLPMTIQRSISFLPIEVHPLARQDALGTTDWRWQMWKTVFPDIPKYLLLGKGYNFDSTDFLLTKMAQERQQIATYEDTLVSGNYHSGPLTLIIPFGIFGVLAFVAFCWGGLKALWQNYLYGDASLTIINRFLFVYFLSRLIYYTIIYGQFDLDLMHFTGMVGFSIALNGGVRRKAAVNQNSATAHSPDLAGNHTPPVISAS